MHWRTKIVASHFISLTQAALRQKIGSAFRHPSKFKCGGIHFKKKEVYLTVSLVAGVLLSAALINDFVAIFELEMPEHTTQNFTFTVMLLNWISFQMAILAFIYNCLAKNGTAKQVSAVSVAGNMVIFIIRISLELAFIELREEGYAAD